MKIDFSTSTNQMSCKSKPKITLILPLVQDDSAFYTSGICIAFIYVSRIFLLEFGIVQILWYTFVFILFLKSVTFFLKNSEHKIIFNDVKINMKSCVFLLYRLPCSYFDRKSLFANEIPNYLSDNLYISWIWKVISAWFVTWRSNFWKSFYYFE